MTLVESGMLRKIFDDDANACFVRETIGTS
jgi:hypothetical protein